MAAIFQGCILCGLIQTNNRYFELFQTSGGLDAEITDCSFQRYYHSGDFPELSPELRRIIIDRSSVQEQGIRINHIPIRGGHLFWSEDISVLLDQYQDIREQQEELTARNRLLQKAYQKEAERRKTEEQNRLLNMIQNQTVGQLELLSQFMNELERTESREQYDRILGKIVVVGTYLKRRKNLVLTQYASDGNLLTMEDLRQSLAESCDSLKLCRIRAAYYVENADVQLNAEDILKCYDTFEWLVERLVDIMQSVFYRVSQIDDALRISVHIVSEGNVTGVLFSRNFGKEAAIFAGLAQACGDVVAVMDCDLQHPPQTLIEMYRLWQEGYEVIEGVKADRGKEGFLHKECAGFFYDIMSKATKVNMKDASDFKMMDRKAVDSILSMPERNMFFRATSSWVGYKTTSVEFEVQEREAGVSKWSPWSLVKYAFTNIVAFTTFPLQFVTITGAICFICSLVLMVYSLVQYFTGSAVEGYTTLLMVLLLVGSAMMISLGIIGYYISKIYEEVKRRPRYIISKVIKNGNIQD